MNFKKLSALLIAGLSLTLSSCDKFLDINKNPNNPDVVEAALLLAPIQNQYVLGIQFDARYIGSYVQNWHHNAAGTTWDVHGYVQNSDAGGEIWRNVYWRGGRNILNMMDDATAKQRWDYLGVGQVFQAWGWQMLTDIHGEIIIKEAYDQDPNKNTFNYDTQEFAYSEVVRLLQEGIKNLNRSDGAVSTASLGRGDIIYKGDRIKWKKFAYGLLAINAHHLSNKKSIYKPDQVISYVDSALSSNADDALFTFNGLSTADGSFFGPLRQNLQVYGQSAFMLRLLDGTVFNGVKDPRQPILLSASGDGTYRGINAGAGQSTAASVPVATRVPNLWGGQIALAPPVGTTGKFFFTDKGPFPLMTYAQLQFIKAEAAYLKGDMATALAAYRKGIEAHLTSSYVNVSAADRTAYLSNPAIVPTAAADLKLNQIMLQKYIAQWGWGFLEQWADLRRYNYSPDVFTSLQLPTAAFPSFNNGKSVQRLRPRYNSEYVWNQAALQPLGGLEPDYHTKPVWFVQP